jgi:hypothetical protein
MSLILQISQSILQEYIRTSYGKGFRGKEFFKFMITKKFAQWIENEIANRIPDGYIIRKNMNLFTDTHGSQYLTINYIDGHYMTMRISTHHFTSEDKEKPMYQINGWTNDIRNIREEVNRYIDYTTQYFNVVYKQKNGQPLTKEEVSVYEQVRRNIPFKSTENDIFPSLGAITQRGTELQMSKNKYTPTYVNHLD